LRVESSRLRVEGKGFRIKLLWNEHLELRVQGLGFRVQGSGFRVLGLGFRVSGSGFRSLGLKAQRVMI
jgi:hypothetical protein